MIIETSTAISILSGVASMGFAFGMVNNKVAAVWAEIGKLGQWKETHEKEAVDRRLEIQKEMSNVKTVVAVGDSKYLEILRRLTDIEKKIDAKSGGEV